MRFNKILKYIFLHIFIIMLLTGCSSNAPAANGSVPVNAPKQDASVSDILTDDIGGISSGAKGQFSYKTSAIEYELYQNIYYNNMGGDYENKSMTKIGTFASIQDKFNGVKRYYIWGYYDETKCCDWQWELKLSDKDKIPPDGSLVEITGTFTKDKDSLDGYWFTDNKITVKKKYHKSKYDIDMSVMDSTLERVQLMNMQYYPDDFEGKTVKLYGRIQSGNSIQHPYYDNTWSQQLDTKADIPPIGTRVTVSGVYKNGIVSNADIENTDMY